MKAPTATATSVRSPSASARPQWEYKVASVTGAEDAVLNSYMNALGAEGWELTGVSDAFKGTASFSNTILYFKRPL